MRLRYVTPAELRARFLMNGPNYGKILTINRGPEQGDGGDALFCKALPYFLGKMPNFVFEWSAFAYTYGLFIYHK